MPTDSLHERLRSTLGASYTLERELGRGGMGRVFLARDATLERNGALRGDPRFAALAAEATAPR